MAAVPALILLPAAVFFTAVSDLVHPLWMTVSLLAVASFVPIRLRFHDRSMIYLTLLALLLALGGDKLWPLRDGRFHFMTGLLFPSILVPFACYLAALSVLFRRKDLAAGLAVGAAALALLFSADPQSLEPRFYRASLLSCLLRHHPFFFPLFAGCTLLSFLLTMRHIWAEGRNFRREVTALIAILTVFVISGVSIHSYRYFRSTIRGWERMLLNLGSAPVRHHQGEWVFSGNRIRLTETLRKDRGNSGGDVVFQVTGPVAPGYLRGNIYTVYRNGGWEHRAMESGDSFPMLDTGEDLVLETRFSFGEVQDYPVMWEIFPSYKVRSDFLYHPASAEEFRLVADSLELTPDGAVRMKGFVREGGYRILTSQPGLVSDFPRKNAPFPDPVLLSVPVRMQEMLDEILYASGAADARSDQAVFANLLDFFREHFQYDLRLYRRWGEDPVETFLLHSRRGHCELYASALTLLLRQRGIPARYVTGFLCDEPDLFQRSFLARQNNAHAWVEAYDRDRKCWTLLEPTPEVELPQRRFETLYQCLDMLILTLREMLSALHRGLYAQAFSFLLEFFWKIVLLLVQSPLFWIIVLPAGWLVYRWRRRRLRLRGLWGPDRDRRKLIRQYRRKVRSLRRKTGLPRNRIPGAAELADAVRASAMDPEEKERHLEWIRSYRRKRFRFRMPENDASGN